MRVSGPRLPCRLDIAEQGSADGEQVFRAFRVGYCSAGDRQRYPVVCPVVRAGQEERMNDALRDGLQKKKPFSEKR